MKNRYILLLITAAMTLSVTSCNKFLDEMPDSRTELDSEEKIRRILVSAYPTGAYALYTNLMSDDYDDIGTGSGITYSRTMEQAWNWQDDTEESDDSPKVTWEKFYLAIGHANMALQAIEEMGNPEHLAPLRGEALMARAWCHFKLVNLFCQHYTVANATTDLGIPYVEEPETEVSPVYERGTVKDVYEKIHRDIQEALPLIDDTIYKVAKYHFNRLAAYGFAAEFYLYYKDYEKCIEYANEVLGETPENMMRNNSGFNALLDGDPKYLAYINPEVSANLLLMTNYSEVGATGTIYTNNNRYNHADFCSYYEGLYSPSILWNTPAMNTQMTSRFILQPGRWLAGGNTAVAFRFTVPYLFEFTDPVNNIGYAHSVAIAVSADNVLLNRAEAYVLQENYAAAMEDINRWVKMRITPSYATTKTEDQVATYYGPKTDTGGQEYYTSENPTTRKKLSPETPFANDKQEAFIHAILHMRRIEFYHEGSRWFDIKRYGIEITRRIVLDSNYQTPAPDELTEIDVLVPRDPRRAIQIPAAAIGRGMTPNPR